MPRFTYLKANKITTKHEISPDEDDTWYQVTANRSVKLPGQRPHRAIDVVETGPFGNNTFTFESSDEIRYRPTHTSEDT